MKLHLERGTGNNVIRGYTAGRILVNDDVYEHSLLIMSDRILPDWGATKLEDLQDCHFALIAELAPEVVLLGTGARLRFPPASVSAPLVHAGIGLEVMDTQAACRTYNILMGEGRRVAAALLIETGV